MKKLFISQPMRGKSDEEILKEREKAIKSAEKQMDEPVEVIDSFSRHRQMQDLFGILENH